MQEVCYHCGLDCKDEVVHFDDKLFCCNGCKSVYEILNTDSLRNFYELNSNAGIRPSETSDYEFDFLDSPQIQEKLLLFHSESRDVVRFDIPVIHCTSCVWVLENLKDIRKGILSSTVNFTHKTVQIQYNPTEISLKVLAQFLTSMGYKPVIQLDSENAKSDSAYDKSLIIKLGVAGFCFGNTMLFAFPEYFTEFSDVWFEQYKILFRYLMLLLSLPVVFYCAQSYFKSAITGIRHRMMNIDIPISLGIIVLFLRSIYEVAADISSGYFDSLCGLVFFMLVGKFFQQNTYKSLSFDRNYKSFYPLSITKLLDGLPQTTLLSDLEIGDRIWIRNGEMIPADSILIKGNALIDNSFITGESEPIKQNQGEKVYAGGKQRGSVLELEIIKNVDHSYLTSLWQNAESAKSYNSFSTLIENVSRYFTWIILAIALIGGIVWYFIDTTMMFQVVTAVLIVACPCALALSTPFTLGNVMRILGMQQIYTKDTNSIEKLSEINHIVLDKTGTLTEPNMAKINYEGNPLSDEEKSILKASFQNSAHPLSRRLNTYLNEYQLPVSFSNFEEIEGKGIEVIIDKDVYKLGSSSFVTGKNEDEQTAVYVSKNGNYIGKFIFQQVYRNGLQELPQKLSHFVLSLLSGDNNKEEKALNSILGNQINMQFLQNPEDKMHYIENLQSKGDKVMMVGDGLNDAAALQKSNVGVAITDDINSFTPASDIIMKGDRLTLLPNIFRFSQKGMQLVKVSMVISFLYNIVGLSFALAGMLSPLVAAILMPISSISVVLFASLSTWYFGGKYFS